MHPYVLPGILVGTGAAALLYVLLRPAPQKLATGESTTLPKDLVPLFNRMLTGSRKPDAVDAVAKKLDAYGYGLEAGLARKRSAFLRTPPKAAPTPAAPAPAPAPAAPQPKAAPAQAAPQPQPEPKAPPPGVLDLDQPAPPPPPARTQALPILTYTPDLRANSDPGAYYVTSSGSAARDVRQDMKALRFLGYAAPINPGGNVSYSADSSSKTGSFSPAVQAVVKQFQKDTGLTADGWLGKGTRTKLGALVAAKNGSNDAANQAAGVPSVQFAGRVVVGARPVRVLSPGGLRLRAQPATTATVLDYVPTQTLVPALDLVRGPRRERSPGPDSGWMLVEHRGRRGWVPAEWVG